MFRAPELLIMGSGALADAAEASLRRRRRRVERVDDVGRIGARLRAGSVLILTAGADLDRVLPVVAERVTHRGQTSPRVLLLSDRRAPLAPPASVADAGLRIEHIDIERSAARLLLARWPLHVGCDPLFGQQVHLVIAGRTPLADAVLLHALRLAHYSERQPVMTLLCDEPDAWERDFSAAHPQASSFSSLSFRYPEQPVLASDAPVSGVIVCAQPANAGLELADALARTIAAGAGRFARRSARRRRRRARRQPGRLGRPDPAVLAASHGADARGVAGWARRRAGPGHPRTLSRYQCRAGA